MITLTIAEDGVLTLPDDILEHLGLPLSGDVTVEEQSDGSLIMLRTSRSAAS